MGCNNPDIVRIGITVDTFKNYFARRFNFLPVWNSSAVYLAGRVVYYDVTSNFYVSLANGNTNNLPTDATKWQITASNASYVYDQDIDNAYGEACMKFNPNLFKGDDQITLGFLYLSAHFLVKDLQNNGLNSSYFGVVTNRSVGNVSEAYDVPEWLKRSPTFSFLGSTWYGVKYANMIWNRTRGTMKAVWTGTNPA
jgi:hypothetical protein